MSDTAARAAARAGARRWVVRETLGVITVLAALLLSAGRWDWVAAWALAGVYAGWVAANTLLILPYRPDLLAERATRRPERRWDKIILGWVGVLTLAAYVVAGIDARMGWSAVPTWAQWTGGGVATAGYALVTASMRANAYFSTVSRIQADRGQEVATGGPYRVVRHPGYVGAAAFQMATPLLLGSWAALPLGVIGAALMVLRTGLEDRMLTEELPGYTTYASSVRWRLVPGVW